VSTQRIVPVKLQDGKQYVTRGGAIITVRKIPTRLRRQGKAPWRFASETGGWYTDDGFFYGPDSPVAEDIVRPHYQEGETYMAGNVNPMQVRLEARGRRILPPGYAFTSPLGAYAEDGRYVAGTYHALDLLDYAPLQVDAGATLAQAHPFAKLAPVPPPAPPPAPAPPPVPELLAVSEEPDAVPEQAADPIEQPGPVVFNTHDVEEVWAAYRSAIRHGRPHTMQDLIDARRLLLNEVVP
jgi:hypothetical protein